jgi:hypothetical protein
VRAPNCIKLQSWAAAVDCPVFCISPLSCCTDWQLNRVVCVFQKDLNGCAAPARCRTLLGAGSNCSTLYVYVAVEQLLLQDRFSLQFALSNIKRVHTHHQLTADLLRLIHLHLQHAPATHMARSMLLLLCGALLAATAVAQHQRHATGIPRALLQVEDDTAIRAIPSARESPPAAEQSSEPAAAEEEEDGDRPEAPTAGPDPASTSSTSGLPGADIAGCPEYIDTRKYRTTDFKDTLNTTTSISPGRPDADVPAGRWIQVGNYCTRPGLVHVHARH